MPVALKLEVGDLRIKPVDLIIGQPAGYEFSRHTVTLNNPQFQRELEVGRLSMAAYRDCIEYYDRRPSPTLLAPHDAWISHFSLEPGILAKGYGTAIFRAIGRALDEQGLYFRTDPDSEPFSVYSLWRGLEHTREAILVNPFTEDPTNRNDLVGGCYMWVDRGVESVPPSLNRQPAAPSRQTAVPVISYRPLPQEGVRVRL